MSRQLPTDCLYEIFKILDDKATLYSCLLINRSCCEVAVGILWRSIQDFRLSPKIFNTLFICLPNESKELLLKNKILGSIPNSKPPLFNYVSFCKVLEVNKIIKVIVTFFQSRPFMNTHKNKELLTREILKLFTRRPCSLER